MMYVERAVPAVTDRFTASMCSVISFVLALILSSSVCITSGWSEKRESMKKRLEREKTVRQQKLMREGRFELGASLGSSLGDAYQRNFPLGVSARYFLNDQWGIGTQAFLAISSETSLAEEIRAKRSQRVDQSSFTSVGLGVDVDTLYTLIHGKFSPLGITAVRYDLAFTGGLGLLQIVNGDDARFTVAPSLGINSHFFLNEQLAVSVFYKLYVYARADHQVVVSGKVIADEAWSAHGFGGLTFSYFMGKAKVSTE